MGVVTGGGVETAIGSELKHAAVMAALATLDTPGDDGFFVSEGVVFQSVAADALADEVSRGVEEKEVMVVREVGIESNAEEAILLFAEDLDFGNRGAGSGGGMDAADLALELDKKDRSIGGEIESHRAGKVLGDRSGLEAEGINAVSEASDGQSENDSDEGSHIEDAVVAVCLFVQQGDKLWFVDLRAGALQLMLMTDRHWAQSGN